MLKKEVKMKRISTLTMDLWNVSFLVPLCGAKFGALLKSLQFLKLKKKLQSELKAFFILFLKCQATVLIFLKLCYP